MKKRWISGLAVLAMGGAAAMATPSYTAVFLPSNGATNTYALGIASNGQIVGYSSGGLAEALLWTNPYSSPADLNPAGTLNGSSGRTDGNIQVGQYSPPGSDYQAALWQGTASSLIDMTPPGFVDSAISDIAGGQEAGGGTTISAGPSYALLWSGANPNALNINPPGYQSSVASGTNGSQQVGYGMTNTSGQVGAAHALLWSGTAASAVDITPTGYIEAHAYGISDNFVVGSGSPASGQLHALLWNIDNGTFVDLDPPDGRSEAYAVAGNFQAGYIWADDGDQAAVWESTVASVIYLDGYLPSNLQNAYSTAFGVDQFGDVVGEVDTPTGAQAVLWLAPEPIPFSMAAAGLFLIVRRKRDRQ